MSELIIARVRRLYAAWHVVVLAWCLSAGLLAESYDRTPLDLPPVMLWAWERPEDLSYIDARRVGVAYLAQTITLSGDRFDIRRRVQPLQLPHGAKVEAVTRIEIDPRKQPACSVQQRQAIVDNVVKISRAHKVSAVQIDFDARENERQFYADLLNQLRPQLPDHVGLSITALVSWCLYDQWLGSLPVDEAVPMMFRMGRDHGKVLVHFRNKRNFAHAICDESIGISLDEPQVNAVMRQQIAARRSSTLAPRVYVFSPGRWTRAAAARAVQFGDTKPGS